MVNMTATMPAKTFVVPSEVWSRVNPRATGSRRADLVRARKAHDCCGCDRPIVPGELYYVVVIPSAGLASKKEPERIHVECLEGARDEAACRVPVPPDQFPVRFGGPIAV